MKLIYLITLSFLLTITFYTSAFGQETKKAGCPEINKSDIFLIHGYILHEAKMQKKSSLNVTSSVRSGSVYRKKSKGPLRDGSFVF